MNHDETQSEWEIISCYTRADAIRDGELVEVTPLAAEKLSVFGGFPVPVALTRALFLIASDFDFFSGEDVKARIRTILSSALISFRLTKHSQSAFVTFPVLLTDSQRSVVAHDLVLHCGPGDDATPVVTIGFAEDF
jgi:hypothetical protein